MKSWRTITAAALVASGPASVVLAGGKCVPNLNLAPVFPLVICVERQDTDSSFIGNGFPWENDTTFFANYRNQFLYPSATIAAVSVRAVTIESLQARAVSFSGGSTNNYASVAPQFIKAQLSSVTNLNKTFAANWNPAEIQVLNIPGNKTIGMTAGPQGALLSDCLTCPGATMVDRNILTPAIDLRNPAHQNKGVLVDTLMRPAVGGGSSGNGVWDITSGACSQPQRAYGSGSFVNSNAVTTAFGVDDMAFVWVFRGLALPPPATVQQQVAEIIRLLITPQGLRCSGIDLTPNGKPEDNPLNFPDGKDWDPVSRQVSNGNPIMGEETDDGSLRKAGWRP